MLRNGNGNAPSIAGANDSAGGDEPGESVAETLVANAELDAELGATEGMANAAEHVEQEAVEIAGRIGFEGRVGAGDDGEVDVDVVARDEPHAKRIGGGSGTVLDREEEDVLLSTNHARPDNEFGKTGARSIGCDDVSELPSILAA